MDFTGIASITYTAADMAEAKRLFTDWGLTKVSATRTRLVFETVTGNRIEVRPDDTPGLPARLEGGSSFREVVFGVATAARRDAIAADLARDREVTRDADGTVDRSPPPTPEVKKILKEVKRGILRSVPRLRALSPSTAAAH
jgi:hypothetical protein